MSTETYGRSWSLLTSMFFVTLLVLALFPLDELISRGLKDLRLGPDFRVELQTVQQYGQLSVTLTGLAIVWLVDPPKRRRLLDWLAAVGATSLGCFLLKMCLGRPRPKFDDATTFVGLWYAYPFPSKTGEIVFRYSWDLTNRHPWDLWSMPSSHAALATVMSVFLVSLYPRLRPFGVTMVALVCGCRVLFREHYMTDVIVGAAVGYVIAQYAVTFCWGQRLVNWLQWKREGRRASETSVPVSAD